MKLSYRGVNYAEARSTLELTDAEIANRFRGQNREFRYLRHIPEPLHDRKYCGVSYRSAQPSAFEGKLAEQPVAAVSCQTLPARNKCEIVNERMNSHIRSISAAWNIGCR